MIYQRTLQASIQSIGVGLHSGERVQLNLHPAPPNFGIVFRRTDLVPPRDVIVNPSLINDTRLSSTLVTDEGVRVGTIEHLMSAFAGLGVDNVLVEVTAGEIPIMDGSSAPFVYLLQTAGIQEQVPALKRYLRVKQTVDYVEDDKWVKFEPFDGFSVALSLEFNHPAFNADNQKHCIDFSKYSYLDEIARARTFGFMHEVEYMKTQGLGLGGSLDNAIVIDDEFVLNPEGLRYPDEFVRHKILDAIGDLYVVGSPLIAAFSGHKSGHAMNNQLLRKLLATPSAYEWVTFNDPLDVPSSFHALPQLDK